MSQDCSRRPAITYYLAGFRTPFHHFVLAEQTRPTLPPDKARTMISTLIDRIFLLVLAIWCSSVVKFNLK